MSEFGPDTVVRHLIDVGLLTAKDLVDAGVHVEPGYGRNDNYRAIRGDGSGWMLKHASFGVSDRAALGRERAFYERVRRDPAWAALAALVPPFAGPGPDAHSLLLELAHDATNAHDMEDSSGPVAFPAIGVLVGTALATCHGVLCADWPGTTLEGGLVPWVLDIASPDPGWLRDVSPAQLEVIRTVQQESAVTAALDALRAAWHSSVLTHGDVKWGNVLVRTDPGSREPREILLVDWECAFVGDGAWDVGSAFHSFLADGVHSVVDTEGSAAGASRAFAANLPLMQDQIRDCWSAYVRARRLGSEERGALLSRVTLACGARLIQSAYEWAGGDDGVTRGAAAMLQLAASILRRPAAATRDLFGLASGVA